MSGQGEAFLGVGEATSFLKRVSFRSGSNTGSSRSSAGVSGTFAASAPSYGIESSFRSEEHTSELQSHSDLVCRLLLEKKKECQMNATSVADRFAWQLLFADGTGTLRNIRKEPPLNAAIMC